MPRPAGRARPPRPSPTPASRARAFGPRTYAVQLAHAVAELERPVVTHRREDRRLDGPARALRGRRSGCSPWPRRASATRRPSASSATTTRPPGTFVLIGGPDPTARSYSATARAATCDHSCSGGWATFQARIRATSPGSLARRGDGRRHLRVARHDKPVHAIRHELADARAGSADDRQARRSAPRGLRSRTTRDERVTGRRRRRHTARAARRAAPAPAATPSRGGARARGPPPCGGRAPPPAPSATRSRVRPSARPRPRARRERPVACGARGAWP